VQIHVQVELVKVSIIITQDNILLWLPIKPALFAIICVPRALTYLPAPYATLALDTTTFGRIGLMRLITIVTSTAQEGTTISTKASLSTIQLMAPARGVILCALGAIMGLVLNAFLA
jgi:hypothetical protein